MFTGPVRRMDFNLRNEFPDLQTKIYYVGNDTYYIHCINGGSNFKAIKDHFNQKVKYITARVGVIETVPANFISEVPTMADKEAEGGMEGTFFSSFDLLNLLIAKFPKVHFYNTSTKGGGIVVVHIATFREEKDGTIFYRYLTNDQKIEVTRFLEHLNSFPFELVEDSLTACPDLSAPNLMNEVFELNAANLQRKKAQEYSLRDEALWFDNINNIFNQTFTKKDLYFYEPNTYSCYTDYGTFPNIDLVNHLFLFHTAFISLPLKTDIAQWLKKNKLTRAEFVELVRRKRVKVILTHPETWYDPDFLQEIYEADATGLITRRAIAALQQMDIVELSSNYLLNEDGAFDELDKFLQATNKKLNLEPDFYKNLLLWPFRARKQSFDMLNRVGLMSISNYGVNTVVESHISKLAKKDLSFEFMIHSHQIHLAHSLNATYFPYKSETGHTDYGYASIMGEYLNLFKHATAREVQQYEKMKRKINSGVQQISPIEVIAIDERISILDVEEVLSKEVIFPGSKRLMETLSVLTEEERKKKIAFYNEEVRKKLGRQDKSEGLIDLLKDLALDEVVSLPLGILNAILPYLGIQKKIPSLKELPDKVNEFFSVDPDNLNIHYLTKIDRVAKLKRDRG